MNRRRFIQLIAVNIAAAVVLLLVAIYVSDALKIATFPTLLLLLTTLFRLALEVSATQLGDVEVIPKPVEYFNLLSALDRICGQTSSAA